MNGNKIIISIGRQFGSGGRVVGMALAKALGFDYYDNELITLAAKEYGLDPEFFRKADEKSEKSLFFQRVEAYFSGGGCWTNSCLSNDQLFQMQSDVIRRLAEEKSCVIVGRCSDYVLRDNPNCISIFLHSTDEDRILRIRKRMSDAASESDEKIVERMRMADKRRAGYYNFYSNKTWGESSTYTLSVDVSALGEEQTVEFILLFLRMRFNGKL